MKRWHVLYLGLLALCSCGNHEDKIKPTRKAISESVYSSVTVQPDSLYEAFAIVNGILEQNLVEEGDSVQKGTPLLQVVNTHPKIVSENARLRLDLARDNLYGNSPVLQGIADEIRSAELKYLNDSIAYFRQEKLWSQNIGSKVEYDRMKLNYELSLNSLMALEDTYIRTERDLNNQWQQAQNNYKTSMVQSDDYTVTSKINGKVYALYKNEGEIVTPQQPLALIGSANSFLLELLVDEVDIVKIELGQKVLVVLDAYQGQVFEAKVHKIYPRKFERNQTFLIEALFKDPPNVLYPGLAGEANIVLAHKTEALIIPKSFVLNGNEVRTSNGTKVITIGLQSMDSVEVLSGIDQNTWIYKPKLP
ncbi:MAG: HlyD family efflux transporter periplasmic adaptor subunit [Flavobacteriaceae bacterium]|nr:HlyD family efflux transporter periplasmic adaptor subunit [Flavobacteriaceae bacterium]